VIAPDQRGYGRTTRLGRNYARRPCLVPAAQSGASTLSAWCRRRAYRSVYAIVGRDVGLLCCLPGARWAAVTVFRLVA